TITTPANCQTPILPPPGLRYAKITPHWLGAPVAGAPAGCAVALLVLPAASAEKPLCEAAERLSRATVWNTSGRGAFSGGAEAAGLAFGSGSNERVIRTASGM